MNKYEEALKRARKVKEKILDSHLAAESREEIARYIDKIIPELAESEDEKHRKWILEYLYDGLRRADEQFKEQFRSAIAWLEKQKKQSIADNDLDEEINRFFDDCIDVHEAKLYGNISERVIPVDCYEMTARHFAKWAEKKKEQKPAEWSEEDEKVISDSCCWLAEYAGYLMDKNYGKASMLMGLTDKLKSLRPQPKREWSKEDEKIHESLIRLYSKEYSGYEWPWSSGTGNFTYGDVVNFLKSIHPQPHWKPSEEQMEALKDAVRLFKETHFEKFHYKIESLYNDLKKLM